MKIIFNGIKHHTTSKIALSYCRRQFSCLIIFVALLFIYTHFLERKALYYPSRKIEFSPAELGLRYEDVFFRTADGVELHGWFVPAEGAVVTILYCHGNAGNISHRVEIAKMFNERKMNFFIFDYRGFGKSKGWPTEKGTYLDAQAAYDYLVGRQDIDRNRIVIFGKSLGAAIAIDLASKVKVAALISESSFTSTRDMARAIYPLLSFWFFLGHNYNAYTRIAKIDAPKLIIHSRDDEIVPFSQGQRLFAKAKPPKEFYVMRGGHNDAFYIYNAECMQKISDFLKRYIK